MHRPPNTEDTVTEYLNSMSHWGEWGPDDQRGALNLIGPAKVLAACRSVDATVSGSAVGRLLQFALNPTPSEAPVPPVHFMRRAGEAAPAKGMASASDWAGLPLHGLYITHLDAPSHIFWNGSMYNGRPAVAVTTDRGALVGSVDQAAEGIITRGVLLDVPAVRDVDWLEDGEGVFETDLLAAEARAGLHVEPGDVLLVRTGYGKRRPTAGAALPGLTVDSLPFINDRRPAVLGTDSGTDRDSLSGYQSLEAPVHAVCIVAMGM